MGVSLPLRMVKQDANATRFGVKITEMNDSGTKTEGSGVSTIYPGDILVGFR